MSERWPGGIVRSTPVTPTGPLQNGTAPGIWTMEQAAYWQRQGLWPTAGNFLAVEDVFSTWLYTGDGGTQTITNGINLSGQGGMVWIKSRSSAQSHIVFDTNRGVQNRLSTNFTSAQTTTSNSLTAFNSNGFSIGDFASINTSSTTYASWTFREAAKFFDVVTFTTNSSGGATLNHSLGVAPGMVVMKATGTTSEWSVYHRSLTAGFGLALNTTAAQTNLGLSYTATSSTFVIPDGMFAGNTAYVAYLYAHDTSSTGIIQCGSYTGTGSSPGPTINLGWEPQWVMIKNAGATGGWRMVDNMRGMTVGTAYNDKYIYANTSGAESDDRHLTPNATGFQIFGTDPSTNTNGLTYIYIAIRRGPMKTPTVGTSVFVPILQQTGTLTTGFPIDTQFARWTGGPYANNTTVNDRLRAFSSTTTANTTGALITSSTSAETIAINTLNWTNTTAGVPVQLDGTTGIYWNFRRAPSFFDEVCYTGTGVARTVNHNLGVAPELMIVKGRNNTTNWIVYSAATAATNYLVLDLTNASTAWSSAWNNTAPTSSVFTVGDAAATNANGINLVAYLFASCPGVSKVGSYTGNGSSQTINCGFAAGARFVMIKRTDSTGDWYVWDTARGIVAANDPYLALNNTNAEVTTNDSVDTDNSGFIVNQVAASNVNVNGASYIFLAVA